MMSVVAASASNAPIDRTRNAAAPLKAFLIPSVFGDEPQLQDLRRRLQDTISFDLLAMPDVGARGSLLTDMAATGPRLSRRDPAPFPGWTACPRGLQLRGQHGPRSCDSAFRHWTRSGISRRARWSVRATQGGSTSERWCAARRITQAAESPCCRRHQVHGVHTTLGGQSDTFQANRGRPHAGSATRHALASPKQGIDQLEAPRVFGARPAHLDRRLWSRQPGTLG